MFPPTRDRRNVSPDQGQTSRALSVKFRGGRGKGSGEGEKGGEGGGILLAGENPRREEVVLV